MKRRELVSLFFFLSLILIIIMDSALFLPNEVLIAADLGIYFDTIGIIISIYTIVNGISILIFGYLTDTIDRKKILILAGNPDITKKVQSRQWDIGGDRYWISPEKEF